MDLRSHYSHRERASTDGARTYPTRAVGLIDLEWSLGGKKGCCAASSPLATARSSGQSRARKASDASARRESMWREHRVLIPYGMRSNDIQRISVNMYSSMHASADDTAGLSSDEEAVRLALERFGSALRRHREAAGMTQARAASAVGSTQGYWSRLERAEGDPNLGLVLRIVALFQLDSIEALFGPSASGVLMGVRRDDASGPIV